MKGQQLLGVGKNKLSGMQEFEKITGVASTSPPKRGSITSMEVPKKSQNTAMFGGSPEKQLQEELKKEKK